ncbi:MAG: hypothetical protein PHU40_12185 [Sulfurimonas sp.]|nr:hypothetical protein [Sulfurimonas sp.]
MHQQFKLGWFYENNSIKENYRKWFKKATVKIIPITDIDCSENIEKVINDLVKMNV